MSARRWRADSGVATVAACLALTGLLAASVLIGQVGAVVVARHRAQAAADLSALAAAGAVDSGAEAACTRAREIAAAMRVGVRSCTITGWDATLTVESSVTAGPLGTHAVKAVARAGPVDDNS
ncbi:Rv3654c family TadE-like protein [Nocardia terpenica]|uniref:Pilus assembly protein TadE n=1 Tax=Nocardia terpenica TaxID=455432 RepID=A0A164HNP0_9NOCA|nr:Rv3654c family TadE-like protein [Nocardia terpenica]KZM68667.1 pilus assembly protein TadE [Nocardia terpenica]NQE88340.1 flp pilus-assembly TadE/G-like family protein [Nocardia terpenica]